MIIQRRTAGLLSSLSVIGMAGSLAYAAPALAQSKEGASDSFGGDIVVTARKREEDILKTPVTVTALTNEQLEIRGVVSMQDLATSTPSININNGSSGHADRSFQQISLRGFTPVTATSTTTSMFIDGVPVASPTQVTSLSNPERIEVIKGPQSAYFGRNTFAGAVNVVNREPSDFWTGSVTGMAGTYNNWRIQGVIEGPIAGDALTVRLTGDKFSKGGSWTNETDGSKLGAESTMTATAYIVAKPADGLSIKLFGVLTKDKDGPSAQTRILAKDIVDYSGNVYYNSQANCTINGHPYICGALPKNINGTSANTTVSSAIANYLTSSASVLDASDRISEYGLLRKTKHGHAIVDYELTDSLSLSANVGIDRETWSTLIDLDGFDTSMIAGSGALYANSGFFDYPYLIERKTGDWSAEGRLSYDKGPLHLVGGVSYLDSYLIAGQGSPIFGGSYTVGGKSQSKTLGIFGGITYDVTPDISISAEGRYQIDKLYSFAGARGVTITEAIYIPVGTYSAGDLLLKGNFKNFTPRVIVNWQATPDFMVYASAAKGVNPALFNTFIISQSAAIQQQAKDGGVPLIVEPENLWNYEIGVKGKALGGNLRYTAAAYYAQWRNQITAYSFIVNGALYAGYANAGATDVYGIEGDLSLRVNDLISLDAAGAINVTDVQKFSYPTVTTFTGISDFSGKQLPNTSKYSASAGITFGGNVVGQENTTWFWRTDWNYKSGVYSNVANTTRLKDRNVVNTRVGISIDKLSLQLFVNNVFNNKSPISLNDNYAIDPTFAFSAYSALQVGLPEKRTAGIQAKVTF